MAGRDGRERSRGQPQATAPLTGRQSPRPAPRARREPSFHSCVRGLNGLHFL